MELLYPAWDVDSNIYRLDINEIQEQSKQNTMPKFGTCFAQMTKYKHQPRIPKQLLRFPFVHLQNIPKFDDEINKSINRFTPTSRAGLLNSN